MHILGRVGCQASRRLTARPDMWYVVHSTVLPQPCIDTNLQMSHTGLQIHALHNQHCNLTQGPNKHEAAQHHLQPHQPLPTINPRSRNHRLTACVPQGTGSLRPYLSCQLPFGNPGGRVDSMLAARATDGRPRSLAQSSCAPKTRESRSNALICDDQSTQICDLETGAR